MALLSLRNVCFHYGGGPLLENVTAKVDDGERLGLLGRNGAGKSTLLRLMEGELEADSGEIVRKPGLRTARLVQEVPGGLSGSVRQIVASGLVNDADDTDTLNTVERILSQTGLEPTESFAALSSGMKRRALIAKTLAGSPELLLLDEPTNHLDIESIQWLEGFLPRMATALVFVTHDREFLRRLSTRILDIDRSAVASWDCNYETYLERKDAAIEAQITQDAAFDKKMAREEVWIRRGIKARRTRNEGRVRALEKMRAERAQRRQRVGTAKFVATTGAKSGRIVIETNRLGFSYGTQPVFENLTTIVSRGDRVGIIGPNGAGKTTLLRTMLGELAPTSGNVRLGTNLEIAYFDQLRLQIDESRTVQENVSDGGGEFLTINGKSRHIIGYLEDFLFEPSRARVPVSQLSGGEKNRVMLAKLFTRSSNLLVLDEPTNDLDLETLDLLEDQLLQYSGTILLVSHDRAFLNNVVTSTLVLGENGSVREFVGGYDDWLRQRQSGKIPTSTSDRSKETKRSSSRDKKLGY